jgi:hypothetical protein
MLHNHPAHLKSQPTVGDDAETSLSPIPPDDASSSTTPRPEAVTDTEGEHPSNDEVGQGDHGSDDTTTPRAPGIPAAEQSPATTPPDYPAGWPVRRATQLAPPADLTSVIGDSTSAGAEIPLEERIVLAATYCYRTWFASNPVRAKGLLNDVPEFKAIYVAPNALGTLLGRGVAGHGLGLFRQGDIYPPTYTNGWQLAQRLSPAQLERVSHRLGFESVEDLAAAIRRLPETYP